MPKVIAFREEDITPELLLNQLLETDDITKLLIVVERGDTWIAHYCSGFTIEEMVLALELFKAEMLSSVAKRRDDARYRESW